MSLRFKILLAIALFEAVLFGILTWNALAVLGESQDQELRARAATDAILLAAAAKNPVLATDVAALENLITDSLKAPEMVYARVLGKNNSLLAEEGTVYGLQHAFSPDDHLDSVDDGIFDTAVDISDGGISLGQVQLGLSTDMLQGYLAAARYKTLGIAILGMLFVIPLSLLLASYVSRPFRKLTAAMERIAKGEFGYQMSMRGCSEATQTAAAFNHMSSRVGELYADAREDDSRKSVILDSTVDCIITTDQQGCITEFNLPAQATFGLRREQVLGKPARYLIAANSRAIFTNSIARCAPTGAAPPGALHIEILALRADKTEFPVELVISATRLGEQPVFTINLRDISERKRAERERQRLMMAVEASPDSIFITDTQGLIRYVNPAFTTITGWTREEIIGKPPGVLKSEQMATGFYTDMWGTLRDGKIWTGRILKRRKQLSTDTGQELFWAQSTIAPIQSTTGELRGYVAVERDVTEAVHREERELYERESAEIRARVSQILQAQRPLQERFQQVLECIAKISGLALPNQGCVLLYEPESKALEVFVTHGENALAVSSEEGCLAFKSSLLDRLPAESEIIISNNSPTNPKAGYYAVPVRHGDNVLGFLVLLSETYPSRDFTRLAMLRLIGEMMGLALANHRVQQELEKARQAAEEAARTKSQFLANMSHEIRTPMYGVIGMLDLLREGSLTPSQGEQVETAYRSAELLLSIIDSILDFSRIEAGELHLEHIDFDVGQAVENVCALLAERAHRKRLELTCFVAAETPDKVRGDPTRLHQVLINLIGNAIKFTGRGEVGVSVKVEDQQQDHVHLRFEVHDTGIGISPEAQARLFRPFSQADGSTSRRHGGTGLGLAISKQLVELMGGEIVLDSLPNQGSTFWFTLRFDNPVRATSPPQPLAGMKMLIVDDNATNCAILENYLERWGVHHDRATTGLAALAKLRQMTASDQPYQVAILDWPMPGIDGLELTRTIRADPALTALRLVLLSPLTQTKHMRTVLSHEFHLHKPVRQSHLYEALVTVTSDKISQFIAINSTTKLPLPQLKGRILLVEDNEVNQTVGLQMLGQLGLYVDLAADGRDAVEAVDCQHYDAILMDCQLPRMDGFEATRVIRARERRLGSPRVPIIALTANAMKDDREACLAAGMDEHLAKPFETRTLGNLLSRWLPVRTPGQQLPGTNPSPTDWRVSASAEPATAAADSSMDQKKLSEVHTLLGSKFCTLMETFATTGNALVQEMREAAVAQDTGTLIDNAHHLKGSSSSLGAIELAELCRTLEEAVRQGQHSDLLAQVEQIAAAHLRACAHLRASL